MLYVLHILCYSVPTKNVKEIIQGRYLVLRMHPATPKAKKIAKACTARKC